MLPSFCHGPIIQHDFTTLSIALKAGILELEINSRLKEVLMVSKMVEKILNTMVEDDLIMEQIDKGFSKGEIVVGTMNSTLQHLHITTIAMLGN